MEKELAALEAMIDDNRSRANVISSHMKNVNSESSHTHVRIINLGPIRREESPN
jgi:hypothetical protein